MLGQMKYWKSILVLVHNAALLVYIMYMTLVYSIGHTTNVYVQLSRGSPNTSERMIVLPHSFTDSPFPSVTCRFSLHTGDISM